MKKQLKEGHYFGETNQKLQFNGITITDTVYTHDYVDWHSHENPYFTFLLKGGLIEENKKERYTLQPGSLLFHNWQDFHRNSKPPIFTRGAHVEINRVWAKNLDFDIDKIEGSIKINRSNIKNLFFKILLESKHQDSFNEASIEFSLLQILSSFDQGNKKLSTKKPSWFNRLEELIYENHEEKITLNKVSSELNLHPVYVSRAFHKYVGISFGRYCREIRLNKALNAILMNEHKLTHIAHLSNYYDQSHMGEDFKKNLQHSPKQVWKMLG
jgi:AraC-like DNA-binding protein